MALNCLTYGFILGASVTVVAFLLVFGLVFFCRRWWARAGAAQQDSYSRVMDSHRSPDLRNSGGAIEMTSHPTFVIAEPEDEPLSALELQVDPQLTPQEFETSWLSFASNRKVNFTLTFGNENIEEILSSQRIKCMASGPPGPKQKFYFFARERGARGALFLIEVMLMTKEREMQTEIRCLSESSMPDFVSYLKAAMKPFSRAQ